MKWVPGVKRPGRQASHSASSGVPQPLHADARAVFSNRIQRLLTNFDLLTSYYNFIRHSLIPVKGEVVDVLN